MGRCRSLAVVRDDGLRLDAVAQKLEPELPPCGQDQGAEAGETFPCAQTEESLGSSAELLRPPAFAFVDRVMLHRW